MNKYLRILWIILLLPTHGWSQTDTTYFDEDWIKTDFDNAVYYRCLKPEPGKGYKVEDHFMSGKLQMTGYFTNHDSEKKEGVFVYYHKDGMKESEGEFKNDKKSGVWKQYNDSGILLSTENYIDGNAEGEWVYYYSGTANVWYKVNYKDGKLDGELTSYYKDGKIKRREFHNNKDGKIKQREFHNYEDTTVTGKCYDEEGNEIAFTPFEKMPKPDYDMNKYLSKNMVYPEKARKKNIEGRVLLKFIVDEDGKIGDVTIIRHVSRELDKEAKRVVSRMPDWEPGVQDDKVVKVYFTLPIMFKLE